MRETQSGGCGCGAVRYRLRGEALFIHACHCSECQRRSGSAYGLTMMIEATQLEVVSGQLQSVAVTTDSGNAKTSYFCGTCGVHLWNDADHRPGVLGFRPGTLDDTADIRPAAHVWTCSKQHWLKLDPAIPAFDQMYNREKLWPAASLARIRALT